LDRRGARLTVWSHLPLDEPHAHAVAGELAGSEQPGGARADNQDVIARYSIILGRQPSGVGHLFSCPAWMVVGRYLENAEA
jgi:hypothetical protein